MAFNARFAENIAQLQALSVAEQPSSQDRPPDSSHAARSQAARSRASRQKSGISSHSVADAVPKSSRRDYMQYDLFKRRFDFQLPNGYESLATKSGCFFTLILLIVLFAYGLLQAVTVATWANSIITNNVIDSFYQDDYVFDLDKKPGLQIAFGITYYDSNQEMIVEPDYGELIARVKKWGGDAIGIEWQQLNIRPCTYEELGLGDEASQEDAKFFRPHKNSDGFIRYYWKKLYCYDEEVGIHGDYESSTVDHLQVSLVRCDPEKRSTCKSEEEITTWMQRLFLVHYHN